MRAVALWYESRLCTLAQLERLTGLNRNLLRDRWKRLGRPTDVPADMLAPSRQGLRQPVAPAKPTKHKPDRSPGWRERELFPNAGKNGFCKVATDNFAGTYDKGFPVYTGVMR